MKYSHWHMGKNLALKTWFRCSSQSFVPSLREGSSRAVVLICLHVSAELQDFRSSLVEEHAVLCECHCTCKLCAQWLQSSNKLK